MPTIRDALLGLEDPLPMRPLALLIILLSCSLPFATSTRAACDPARPVPPSVELAPLDRVLFYGDSLTAGFSRNRHHYATLFEQIAKETYCDFDELVVVAKGRRGSHYARYDRLVTQVLREAEEPFSVIMFQDAGKALRLEHPRRPDSPRIFPNAVLLAIAEANLQAPGARLILATTPPLDSQSARNRFVRLYERQNDWRDHNAVTRSIADSQILSVAPWDTDACYAYNASTGFVWTDDGVHPNAFGDLLLGLSMLKTVGFPREDLALDILSSLDIEITTEDANAIATLVYDAPDTCNP
ncbi:MAG: hypothetical protein ACI8TX_000441 [Hyphomicrobiaceae bacterium]|jgi:hypothetical protein